MSEFPLQEQLIDSVLRFASATLQDPSQISAFFDGVWRPDALPKLRRCRAIQAEVRSWIDNPESPDQMAVSGMLGVNALSDEKDRGIRLAGGLGFRRTVVDAEALKIESRITWTWWITDATLLAICGLAVCTIWQSNLQHKVGLCRRKNCPNYFVDRDSRGKSRIYCKSQECEKILNKQRVKASRKNSRKSK